MPHFHQLETGRLRLRAVAPTDLEPLFVIMNDPAQWAHAPHSRHLDRATTRDWIERAAARWASDGLSYWVVLPPAEDVVIGVGGAQRQRTGAWNLYWRITTAHQRQGLASELGRQALRAAAEHDPNVPAIAWITDTNLASIAVANRLGLELQGAHPDPSDGAERLAFADRPLTSRYYAQP